LVTVHWIQGCRNKYVCILYVRSFACGNCWRHGLAFIQARFFTSKCTSFSNSKLYRTIKNNTHRNHWRWNIQAVEILCICCNICQLFRLEQINNRLCIEINRGRNYLKYDFIMSVTSIKVNNSLVIILESHSNWTKFFSHCKFKILFVSHIRQISA